jgi:hypothetical protein
VKGKETNSVACFASDALTFSAINDRVDDPNQLIL